jgi:hypothetical protein
VNVAALHPAKSEGLAGMYVTHTPVPGGELGHVPW